MSDEQIKATRQRLAWESKRLSAAFSEASLRPTDYNARTSYYYRIAAEVLDAGGFGELLRQAWMEGYDQGWREFRPDDMPPERRVHTAWHDSEVFRLIAKIGDIEDFCDQ